MTKTRLPSVGQVQNPKPVYDLNLLFSRVVEWKNGRVVNHSTTRLISYSTNPLLVIDA
jgi:hypothetical protein